MKIALTARLALAFSGLLLLQTGCNAEQKEKASNKPQETRDKVSYSIGADIGNNLKRSDLDLNPAFLTQGIKDAFTGKTVLTDEEMKSTLQAFQTEMQAKMMAKQKAAGEKNKADSEKFLEENKKKEGVVTTASGLQYKIIKAGDGPKPKPTDTVSVNYRGTLINGTEFDKSKEPVSFQVEGVIPGWVEALQLMPVGSKWQLFIPPALAYGENAPPMIGPNQALVFDVELLDIKKAEKPAEGADASKSAPTTPAAK
ncbi:MAG: FKBP-type peptidyl-prolyl cis-trans isomerase [Verrucomicrobia bacterium]|nr:FKBP-type peptidyl-prolyl cis-trans isomerase [Verrucomicrobiota bacterium]